AFVIAGALALNGFAAQADGLEGPAGMNGFSSAAQTLSKADGVLRLTLDKDVLIRLDQDAASVVVNNPEHAQVMLDSPRLLIVMPRQPGATSFSVLNAKGETILNKTVIVSGVHKNY